jgi:hypothetical protein
MEVVVDDRALMVARERHRDGALVNGIHARVIPTPTVVVRLTLSKGAVAHEMGTALEDPQSHGD